MANPTSVPPQKVSAFSAPKILLMGAPGTGKTWSLWTALKAGLKLRVIATEANAIDSIFDACLKNGVSTDNLEWKYVLPARASWSSLADMAKKINSMGYDDLASIKAGIDKTHTAQFGELIKVFANFVSDRTGHSFGDCAIWGDDTMLVLDSLSGLNTLSRLNHVGFKPTMHQGEWGVVMAAEEFIINSLCDGLNCYFVLTGHIDREQDLVSGSTRITPAALGAKLAPKLGRNFSEVVLAKKEKATFLWSTSEMYTDVKNRALPIGDKLEPSFLPIVEAHNRRKQQSAGSSTPTAVSV